MTDPQSQPSAPMLHFLCGKIGAGKSTLAAALASQPGALRISETTGWRRCTPARSTAWMTTCAAPAGCARSSRRMCGRCWTRV